MKLLEPIGFKVREAVNGEEAINLWQSWSPHLIWMDMRMPVMDGKEATRHIKASTKGQDTAIIALTASVFAEHKDVLLKAGCDDFVCKPFKEEEIFSKMAQYLNIKYIYQELPPITQENSQTITQREILSAESLTVMSQEWISQLHQAATRLNNKEIAQLIRQIPE